MASLRAVKCTHWHIYFVLTLTCASDVVREEILSTQCLGVKAFTFQ